ncbi:hypothetical protein JCM13664_08190 [Methylothermus subterraneus]
MVKRWWTIFILLILVTGLAAWVYWIERAPEPTPLPLLADFDPGKVRHIVIERRTDRLEFTRAEDVWRMTEPFQALADAYHIQQLLDLPKQTSPTRYPAAGMDLARFELQPPQAIVRLDAVEFRFGGQNPLNFQRYLQVGDVIHLLDDALFYSLTAPATTWVEHQLLPQGPLQALELPGWRITATEAGGWTSEPAAPAADLERLVDTWRTARAVQITPATEEPSPEQPRIRVSIAGQTLEFVVLQREPELILLRPEQKLRYHFYGSVGQNLLTPKPSSPSDAGASRSRDDTPKS